MKKCGDFDSYGAFFVYQNNLSGIGKGMAIQNSFWKLVLRVIFGDFTKSDPEKWLEKKGMETEIRENVDIFCKVTGYFINGYFTKRW